MSKHTPGPWKKQKFGNSYEIFACDDVQSYIAGVNLDNPDNKANAQLISTAPELLEAAEKALKEIKLHREHHWGSFGKDLIPKLEKTIKKARGEDINE